MAIKKFNDFTKKIEEGILDRFKKSKETPEVPSEETDFDYSQGGRYREVEPGNWVPANRAFSPDKLFKDDIISYITDILDSELETREVPYGDGDIEIDPTSKDRAAEKIFIYLQSKGFREFKK